MRYQSRTKQIKAEQKLTLKRSGGEIPTESWREEHLRRRLWIRSATATQERKGVGGGGGESGDADINVFNHGVVAGASEPPIRAAARSGDYNSSFLPDHA